MIPEKVELKGFLYRTADGKIVLADSPHIKSCCIDKPSTQKIYLEMIYDGPLPIQLTTVQGFLIQNPVPFLKDAKIQSEPSSFGIVLFSILPIIFIAKFILRMTQKVKI